MPGRVSQGKMCHRVASEHLSVNDSARRRLPTQVHMISMAEHRSLELMNQSMHRPEAELLAKRAGKERGWRALRVSCRRRSEAVARLPQPSMDRDSNKAERESQEKKHRRQAHNSLREIVPAALDDNCGAAFCCSEVCVKNQALSTASASTTKAKELRSGQRTLQ